MQNDYGSQTAENRPTYLTKIKCDHSGLNPGDGEEDNEEEKTSGCALQDLHDRYEQEKAALLARLRGQWLIHHLSLYL